MREKKQFSNALDSVFKAKVSNLVENFDAIPGGDGKRNIIKIVDVDGMKVNIKAFKIPNPINQIAYNFFRKSKAQRSFEYATILLEKGIGTPKPLAFFEYRNGPFFRESFYISEQLNCDLTYRELITQLNYPDYESILRAFTRFTFKLHELGIQFLDHSPGNTLIKKNGDTYDFYLVDLNRMVFGPLDFETRIKNFSRLTPLKSMVKTMSDEYAKCIGEDYETVFGLMWKETSAFQHKFHRKKRLKKRLKLKER